MDKFPSKISVLRIMNTALTVFIIVSLISSVYLDLRRWQKTSTGVTESPLERLLLLESPGHDKINPAEIQAYLGLFETLLQKDPARIDLRAITAFCLYHLNKKNEALKLYLMSAENFPDFIGFHYNAGVIFYEKGEYANAARQFTMAMSTGIDRNIKIIHQKNLFIPLASKTGSPADRLKREYELSAYFAADCLERLGNRSAADLLRQKSLKSSDLGQGAAPRPVLTIF